VEVDARAEAAAHFEPTIVSPLQCLQEEGEPAFKYCGQNLQDGFMVAGSTGTFTRQETETPTKPNSTKRQIVFIRIGLLRHD
jgi:hypothetical protein